MSNVKFISIPLSLVRRRDIPATAHELYARLDLHQGSKATRRKECAYPSDATLAKDLNLSEDYVSRLKKLLEDKGFGKRGPKHTFKIFGEYCEPLVIKKEDKINGEEESGQMTGKTRKVSQKAKTNGQMTGKKRSNDREIPVNQPGNTGHMTGESGDIPLESNGNPALKEEEKEKKKKSLKDTTLTPGGVVSPGGDKSTEGRPPQTPNTSSSQGGTPPSNPPKDFEDEIEIEPTQQERDRETYFKLTEIEIEQSNKFLGFTGHPQDQSLEDIPDTCEECGTTLDQRHSEYGPFGYCKKCKKKYNPKRKEDSQ